ncbi:MAG: hypothetical protein U0359_03685 [Byssovorax sp.]
MPRLAAALLVPALLLAAAQARADKVPDAAQVRAAAEHFDAGASAFKARSFEDAASHFEAADAAVPTAKTLRAAIRARTEAGQGSRAATLAAQALERYPGDDATVKLAKDTIAQVEPLVMTLKVSCASPCVLAIGTRSVPGEANTRWTVYLDPGKVTLAASFFGGTSAQQEINAAAGASRDIRFEPQEAPSPRKPAATAPPIKGDTPKSDTPKSDATKDDAAKSDAAKDDAPPAEETPGKGIHPAFFFAGLVATAGVGGVMTWSAVDTLQNPGKQAVDQACTIDKTPDCNALLAQGAANERRTNILIGATAGTAAVTLVLGIFTNWQRLKKKGDPKVQAFVSPLAGPSAQGSLLGVRGQF